nr:peptidoglycan DD-metalloendopeptidase family protein [Kocuria rhizophila]
MARSRARSSATRGPSMALVAFTSFSLLVAGGVALSNGTEVAPWQPAMAHDANGPQRAGTPARAQDDAAARPAELSLFASRPDRAAIDSARDASLVALSSTAPSAGGGHGGNGRGGPRRATVPPVTTAEHAPPVFDGKLPVNTLIAPAQPVIVLKGGEFGWRTAPDTGQHELHNGTDISAPEGTPVVAALDGTVTAVFWDVWGGNRVEVSHANGMKTTYNHLSRIMVREGDTLKASEQLGEVGHTGMRVTGPHLHFETWVGGEVVDAQSFDWKTGKDIIRASRPAYSTADQAPATPPGGGTHRAPSPSKGGKGTDEVVALGGQSPKAKDAPKKSTAGQGKKPSTGPRTPAPTGGKGSQKPAPSTSSKPRPSTPAPTRPGTGHPTQPKPTQPEPTKPQPTQPEPKPTQPKPTQPEPKPTNPGTPPLDPRTAPIDTLTTAQQLHQRTQSVLAAHLQLGAGDQAKAYVIGSPLESQLQALVTRSVALKLPAEDPYVAQLNAAHRAVVAAAKAPQDAKAATAKLQALQEIATRTPPYTPPAAASDAVPAPAAPNR